jgi:aspartyl-tRNA(Asn)/glutamyl-tRNA(Gln) amidotransferase subunit C
MPEISLPEVKHVALLAHLALSEEELLSVGNNLNRILEHFRALAEIDTAGTPITSHAIPILNSFRQDVVGESLTVEQVVANAPDGVDEFFRVPRIVEE